MSSAAPDGACAVKKTMPGSRGERDGDSQEGGPDISWKASRRRWHLGPYLHMVKEPGKKHVTGWLFRESLLNRMLGKEVKAGRNLDFVGKCESYKKMPLLGSSSSAYKHLLYPPHCMSCVCVCVCVCVYCILLWDDHSGVATRRDEGDSQEKSKQSKVYYIYRSWDRSRAMWERPRWGQAGEGRKGAAALRPRPLLGFPRERQGRVDAQLRID